MFHMKNVLSGMFLWVALATVTANMVPKLSGKINVGRGLMQGNKFLISRGVYLLIALHLVIDDNALSLSIE